MTEVRDEKKEEISFDTGYTAINNNQRHKSYENYSSCKENGYGTSIRC